MAQRHATVNLNIVAHIMAQQILVPVKFEFEVSKVEWAEATGQIYGWDGVDFSGLLTIKGLKEERPFKLLHRDLPRELREQCDEALGEATYSYELPGGKSITERTDDPSVEKICRDFRIELFAQRPIYGQEKPADPWAMRDAFLRVPHEKTNVLAFLNQWGSWDTKEYLRLQDFTRFQKTVRRWLVSPPERWFEEFGEEADRSILGLFPDEKSKYPYFWAGTHRCRDAILTTITFDKFRGIKFANCARPDCPNPPYEITSKHGRMYCSQYCAHLESVRRKRKERE
jgi:hypothetical protein